MILLAAAVVAGGRLAAEAQIQPRLVSQDEVGRLGLERAWFAQVQLDRARNDVERAILSGDQLIVLTSAGVVHALDANTGETLWIAPIGNPDYPSMGPAANSDVVALVNGSTLYVLDRSDGRPNKIRSVGGAPGASPALSDDYVFVPLVNGRIEGYPLDEETDAPWFYQSYGRTLVPPAATPETLAWTTDRGDLYVAGSDDPAVRFRLETGSEFMASPAYGRESLYAANMGGEVFAIDPSRGGRRWKFVAGYPVLRAPAIVDQRLFVTTGMPALYAIDAETGTGLWEAEGITQFAAASGTRIYAIDELASLVVLDAKSGAPLARLATDGLTNALVNDQTDRLFLVTADGLVQCLHELGAEEPLYHNRPADAQSEQPGEPTDVPETTPPTSEDVDPFPTGEPGEDAEAMEEEAPAEQPAEETPFGVDDENPFGF